MHYICDLRNSPCILRTDNDGTPCTNLDRCIIQSACERGSCVAKVNKVCPPPSSPCLTSACAPGTGDGVTRSVAGGCDDGDPCTTGDQCLSGMCAAGSRVTAC